MMAPTDSGLPLSPDEFEARLCAMAAPRRLVLAVSGGPDSIALARLAAAGPRDCLAVTIDHGLRPEASAEAAQAGEWCRAAGLAHRVLDWRGEKPRTGVQAAARAARYRLLARLAETEGYEAVLTAHTADDQAETVFMRLARGSGPSGLAGMAPEILIAAGAGAPVRLLRPLLDVSRARLAASLAAMGQAAIGDPSNDDPAFERVRTRALLAALEAQGLLTQDALRRAGARAAAAAKRLETADLAAFAAAGGTLHPEGWVSLDAGNDTPPSLVARLIRAVSGGDHAPTEEEAATAAAAARASGAATLAGALVKRRQGRLAFFREPAALLGRTGLAPMVAVTLAPGGRLLWDGRFILANEGAASLTVSPRGAVAAGEPPDNETHPAPPEALATFPAAAAATAAGPESAETSAELRVQSLLEERFFAPVLRFSEG